MNLPKMSQSIFSLSLYPSTWLYYTSLAYTTIHPTTLPYTSHVVGLSHPLMNMKEWLHQGANNTTHYTIPHYSIPHNTLAHFLLNVQSVISYSAFLTNNPYKTYVIEVFRFWIICVVFITKDVQNKDVQMTLQLAHSLVIKSIVDT